MIGQKLNTRKRFRLNYEVYEIANGLLASIKAQIRQRNHKFTFNDDIKNQILKVATWLTSENASPGLILMGKPGNGKTTLLRAVGLLITYILDKEEPAEYRRHQVVFMTARRISELCTTSEGQREYRRLLDLPFLSIDDLGEEPTEVIVYGKVNKPLLDLLLHRYERQLPTFITTNLPGEDIGRKYGGRLLDRFREMVTPIIFKNPSYRPSLC